MVRLKDIASLTGVNVSTVSKALRGRDDINPETRQRIMEAAKSLKYSSRKSKPVAATTTIGVICPEIRSGYYAKVITALESQLCRHGFGMLLGLSDFVHSREVALLEQFRGQSV
jgi:LacI family transcriptional regulator